MVNKINMTELTEDIHDFRCSECGFFGTSADLDYILLHDGTCNEAHCPECGHIIISKDIENDDDNIDNFDDDDSYDNY